MKKTLRELTTVLQTLCHEGHSNCEVLIGHLDNVYDIDDIKTQSDPDGKISFVIKAEVAE